MKNIINYFNNNAFVASIITLLLSALITVFINIIERKQSRKDIIKDRDRDERLNKGEFRMDRYIKGEFNDNIDLIYTDYKVKFNENRMEDIIYDKKIIDNMQCETIYFPLKNIGNKEICEFYITVNNRAKFVLMERDRIDSAVNGKYANYVVGYYNKILPGESILVGLNYLKNSEIFSIGSELTIYYRDGYGNFYSQPVFLGEQRVEGPYIVKPKDYLKKTSPIV